MSKSEGAVPRSGWWMQTLNELLKTDIYKRSQGKIVRQATCITIWVAVALGAFQFHHFLRSPQIQASLPVAYILPTLLLVAGVWLGYRLVNMASFADFLIAVEAEMNKVSWPSKTELIRASMVVILLMFGLAVVLFSYDVILHWFFKLIGVAV